MSLPPMIVQLHAAANGLCRYCREPTFLTGVPVDHPFRATKDHIDPKSWGGASAPHNYALACFACNQAKGEMPLPDPEVRARVIRRFYMTPAERAEEDRQNAREKKRRKRRRRHENEIARLVAEL